MSSNGIFLFAVVAVGLYFYSKSQGSFGQTTIPGSFEKEPGQACPAGYFELFVDGKTWCVPVGA